MSFPTNLYNLRKSNHLTQVALAKKVGISVRALINYEKGRRTPPQNILVKLSQILDVSVDTLLKTDAPDLDHPDKQIFFETAEELYGFEGKQDAQTLLSNVKALFAGGTLDPKDQNKFFNALTDIYFESKARQQKKLKG